VLEARQRGSDSESGVVLVVVLLGLAGLSALGLIVALLASLDARIDFVERSRLATLSIAEAGAELAVAELARESDWSGILGGSVPPHVLTPSITAEAAGWGTLNLSALSMRVQRESDARSPWQANSPLWRLFIHGRLADVIAGRPVAGSAYAAIWIADDEAEIDGRPDRDSNGVLSVRVEGYGPGRAHQVVLVTVQRRPQGVQVLSWRWPADRRGG